MYNSDLVEILSALRDDERIRLRAFLETSKGIKDDHLLLVEYVFEQLDKDNAETAFRSDAYTHVYGDKPRVANKLENLMAQTLSFVRSFAAREALANKMTPLQEAAALQAFYNERDMQQKFQQSRRQMTKVREKNGRMEARDYYALFRSEAEEFVFQNGRNRKKDDVNLWQTIQALDEYYLVERFYYTCLLLNQNQLAPLALPPLEECLLFKLDSPRIQWFYDKPLGKLFRKTLDLLLSESGQVKDNFDEYVRMLSEVESAITPVLLGTFEIFACNYGIRQANKGNFSLRESVFQLQKRRVDSGRVYLENKIKASEMHSIVVNGLRLGENQWIKQFIEVNRDRILGVMPSQDYYQFNLVYYYFQTKEYEPDLKTLLDSNYADVPYKILGKILEIKILYERSIERDADAWIADFLEKKVSSASVFFFREKNAPLEKIKMVKDFARTMQRILNAPPAKIDPRRLEAIRAHVAGALISERQWLLKIIDDLLGK